MPDNILLFWVLLCVVFLCAATGAPVRKGKDAMRASCKAAARRLSSMSAVPTSPRQATLPRVHTMPPWQIVGQLLGMSGMCAWSRAPPLQTVPKRPFANAHRGAKPNECIRVCTDIAAGPRPRTKSPTDYRPAASGAGVSAEMGVRSLPLTLACGVSCRPCQTPCAWWPPHNQQFAGTVPQLPCHQKRTGEQ
jgi:hypothetical protein